MYRLLLLDDEKTDLKDIQQEYDLSKYGFEISGAFSNFGEVMKKLEEFSPELVKNNLDNLKNRYYLALTEENRYEAELFDILKSYGQSDFEDDIFMLITIGTDQIFTAGDYVSEIGKLTREAEMILSDYGKVMDFRSDENLYFVLYDLEGNQWENVCDAVNSLIETWSYEGIILTVGFSQIHSGQMELFQARNDCIRMIFLNEAKIDAASEANPVKNQELNITMPYPEIENLFRAVSANDERGIWAVLDRIYVIPEKDIPVLSRDYVVSITFLILLRIYQMQHKFNAADDIVKQEWLDLKYLRNEYSTLEDQKNAAGAASVKLAHLIESQKVGTPSKAVQAALDYIGDHFCENVSLQEVADSITISRNYLSDIFKKETGVTFISYVTGLRIEKAKWYLANTDMKMYEVSNAVGYNDYAYFSKIFKKYTGITLSAYRRQL